MHLLQSVYNDEHQELRNGGSLTLRRVKEIADVDIGRHR